MSFSWAFPFREAFVGQASANTVSPVPGREPGVIARQWPTAADPQIAFGSDRQAQEFVDTANLTDYDLSGGTPVQFEFGPKSAHLNVRVPKPLLDAVKECAKERGIPYTRLIRQLMEREVSLSGKPR